MRTLSDLPEPWRTAIAEAQELGDKEVLDLAQVLRLDLNGSTIVDLQPIIHFPNLRWLNISGTEVVDLGPLASATALEVFYADFGWFNDLTPLAGLVNLREIDVTCSLGDLSDVSALANCQRLEKVYLAHSPIESIAPLLYLPSIQLLSVVGIDVPTREIEEFRRLHPRCEIWDSLPEKA